MFVTAKNLAGLQVPLDSPCSLWLRIVMGIDFPPPRRRKEYDYVGRPPSLHVTLALISLWSLLLAGPVSILAIGGVWLWKGWGQALRACGASVIVLVLMFLHTFYLVSRENRLTDRRRPRVSRRPR